MTISDFLRGELTGKEGDKKKSRATKWKEIVF